MLRQNCKIMKMAAELKVREEGLNLRFLSSYDVWVRAVTLS